MTVKSAQQKGYSLTTDEVKNINKTMINEYKLSLAAIKEEIDKVYTKYLSGKSPDEYYFVMSKYNRLNILNKNTEKLYAKSMKEINKLLKEGSRLSFTNNYYRQQYVLQHFEKSNIFSSVSPTVVEISVIGNEAIWKGITEKAVKKIEETYGSLNAYQPKHGTLTDVLVNNKVKTYANIKSSITQGLIQGKGSKEVGKDITKVMNTSVNNANRIAKTEMMRNLNAADYAEYNVAVSKGMNLKRMIQSVLDTRTRQQSAEVDGRIANKDGFLYPNGNRYQYPGNTGVAAYDINDRELIINIVEGISPDQRSARDPVTGKTGIISYVNFDEWADKNGLEYSKSGKLVKK